MQHKYNIAIIICYYGHFPWYFKFFLHSCSFNGSIDFIIFSDIEFVEKLPGNVIVVRKSILEISRLATKKMGLSINIDAPYKLCDFKPAYGEIFSDYIEDYDFWGHGDIDVIYGDIRGFITDDILKNHDFISVRQEYVSGFFALYRNWYVTNQLFRSSKDWQAVFQDTQCKAFDECSYLCDSLADGLLLSDLQTDIESMTHVIKVADEKGIIRAYFDFHVIESIPGHLKWNRGQLVYQNEFEVLLYHLVSFKCHPDLELPSWSTIPDSFCINESSFSIDDF